MKGWMIAVIVAVVIVILVICFIRYLKKKIRNKIVDAGKEIINETTRNILNEEAANKVSEVTNITAEVIKGGKFTLISKAAKKGLEIAKNRKKAEKE